MLYYGQLHSHTTLHSCSCSCSPFQVVVGLKEELSTTQTKLNRLQQEADAKVLARAASHNGNGNRQGGGAGGVASKVPVSLEVRIPPSEPRSSGEVL